MPVEERLRSALVDLAEHVRVDADGPLEQVRRRRTRWLATLWAGSTAVVAALVVGVVAFAPHRVPRPEPTGPSEDRTGAKDRTIPLATYVRTVTDDEVLDAGFSREAVEMMLGGAGRARAELVFRDKAWASEQEGWAVRFVDAQGERRSGERGYYYPTGATSFEHDGDVVLVGTAGASGAGYTYVFSWKLEAGSLVLEPVPTNTDRPTALLLGDGSWQRVGD